MNAIAMPLAITPLRKTRVLLTTLVLGGSTLLSSCTLAPHYERPAPPVASNWTDPAPDPAPAPDATAIGWRDFFTDPRLQRLIELALRENRDLRVAALNVQAAEAQYRVQRASLFPTIDVTALQETEKIPDAVAGIVSGGASAGASAGNTTSGGSGSITEHLASVGVGFTSYELDLFGRIRSLTRTALETYLSDEQTRRSSEISLIAEIASAYLTVCADRAILQVTRETLASQTATLDLTRRTVNLGTGTALTLRQAEITVDTARANLAAYTRQLAQDRNALILLLGAPLPPDAEFADTPEMTLPPALPEGVPSEVLTRRPDVLAAEHQLIGANANIGAARAAFFPSITLTGSLGTESTQLSGLFKPGSQAWSFEPQITLPIFTGGANRANLDLAKIQKNIYIADYEKTIQSAFREVDDALSARATLDAQLAAERALVDAAADAYRLSDMRFRGGVDTFLSVLDAERTLYSAQQGVVTLELSRSQNLATLYKALGGGLLEHSERR